jgi:hypothetical protein
MRRHAGLDTSGFVATGAWASRKPAEVYEHVEVSEVACKARFFYQHRRFGRFLGGLTKKKKKTKRIKGEFPW